MESRSDGDRTSQRTEECVVFSDSLVNLIKRSCIMLNRLRGCARLSLYTFDARYACDEHGDEVRDATRVWSYS